MSSRVDIVADVLAGRRRRLTSPHPDQRPLLFYPGLRVQHFYEPAEFPWLERFRARVPEICDELTQCLRARTGFEPIFPDYASGGRWAGLWFSLYGKTYPENRRAFPSTVSALEEIPSLCGWAGLSALEPGAHIRAHCGVTNAKLRVHCAIRSEMGSRMRVSNQYYTWRDGDVMIFDDSFEHEVWVGGSKPRIVLVFDIYHPDLEPADVSLLERFEREPSAFLRGKSLRGHYQAASAPLVDGHLADWVYELS